MLGKVNDCLTRVVRKVLCAHKRRPFMLHQVANVDNHTQLLLHTATATATATAMWLCGIVCFAVCITWRQLVVLPRQPWVPWKLPSTSNPPSPLPPLSPLAQRATTALGWRQAAVVPRYFTSLNPVRGSGRVSVGNRATAHSSNWWSKRSVLPQRARGQRLQHAMNFTKSTFTGFITLCTTSRAM